MDIGPALLALAFCITDNALAPISFDLIGSQISGRSSGSAFRQRFHGRLRIRCRVTCNLSVRRALVRRRDIVNHILKPVMFLLAGIYFLVDAVFWTLAQPIVRLLADHWVFDSVRRWITSLRPYPTLALFVVPILILEPAKPLAAYLTATGHIAGGLTVLGVAEILKLLLIERLFRISRDKLMSIPAFAWCYGKFQQVRNWTRSLGAWRLARRWGLISKRAVHRYFREFKSSRQQGRLSWQSR